MLGVSFPNRVSATVELSHRQDTISTGRLALQPTQRSHHVRTTLSCQTKTEMASTLTKPRNEARDLQWTNHISPSLFTMSPDTRSNTLSTGPTSNSESKEKDFLDDKNLRRKSYLEVEQLFKDAYINASHAYQPLPLLP